MFDTTDDHDDDRGNYGPRHTAPKVPRPWAEPGSLLHLVQLAHYVNRDTTHHCERGERVKVLGYAKTHTGLLLGTPAPLELIGFVQRSTLPWSVLQDLIHRAMGRRVAAAVA
jgi:hypothetical protein